MPNIHKGKGKLKSTSIMDIATKDVPNNKVFMPDTIAGRRFEEQAKIIEAQKQEQLDQYSQEYEARKAYNASLLTFDPRYSNLKPLRDFIVRLHISTPTVTELGLTLDNARTVMSKTKNGFDDKPITDPFKFTGMAVIVAAPETGTGKIVPGTIWQVRIPELMLQGQRIVGYQGMYLHPLAKRVEAATNVKDPHFGYALIPQAWIAVELDKELLTMENF